MTRRGDGTGGRARTGRGDGGMAARTGAIVSWELASAAFMVLAGSGLHFAFDWSAGWPPLALIAAVNESIWEHLKLAFWPGPYFEHYLFRRDISGDGEVVWGSMKWPTSGVGVALQRLMRAPCE